jgi:hypothetical protein
MWSDRRAVRNSRRDDQARENVPARVTGESSANIPLAERIQSILASKGLTLYRISQQSAALYGQSSPYFLPHNLYYDLRVESFRPSIHQITALSRISSYRLADWLRVFGFSLEDITRLQVLLPSKRTILLDTSLTDPDDWGPWLRNRPNSVAAPPIAPTCAAAGADESPADRLVVESYSARFFVRKSWARGCICIPRCRTGKHRAGQPKSCRRVSAS